MAGAAAVAGEYAGAVAVFVFVYESHGFLQALRARHAQHRAEDLFPVNAHRRRHPVKQASAEKEPVLMAGGREAPSIHRQFSAFLHPRVNIAAHFFAMGFADQGPHVVAGVDAGTDLQLRRLCRQLAHHRVRHFIADARHNRDGHAAFAAGAVSRAQQGVDCVVQVGVRHDDGVIFRAPQGLHPFTMGRSGAVDVFRHRRGAHKADGLDPRVRQQDVNGFLVAVDHIEHPVWQARFLQQLRDADRRAGIFFGRFQHEGVAADQRHGVHPHWHHSWKIERRDAGDHSQGLKLGPAVQAGGDLLAVFPFQQFWRAAGVFDRL